ncbi:MAG: dTDP-4-dehydrorhamnose reductase [Alteromonas naphthalenivorans]|jgi:dTDP-4-dehydrorhamnose reductase
MMIHKHYSNSTLLTGASGKLGSFIQNSKLFGELLCPELEVFDITKPQTVETFFENNSFDTIIHCAAQARVSLAEKDPVTTFQANIIGTANLVSAVLKKEKRLKENIRFIHISTDAVYACDVGGYSEESPTIPYNTYGWAKLGAECAVNVLSDFCIVRTSFFDSRNIPFPDAAIDQFSSKLELEEFIKALKVVVEDDFVGTLNIGSKAMSDYERYKIHKPNLKPTMYEDIQKELSFKMYKNASMNITKWKKLKESNEKAKFKSTKVINSSSSI